VRAGGREAVTKETKTFYEVNAYVKTGSFTHVTFCGSCLQGRGLERAATFKKRYQSRPEVVLAHTLCWSPEEAFKLHIAQAELSVSQAEVALDDAKKNLAKAERAEAQWRETGRETKCEDS
jgi:hypothetical protein